MEEAEKKLATIQAEKKILEENKETLEQELKTFEETVNKLTQEIDVSYSYCVHETIFRVEN